MRGGKIAVGLADVLELAGRIVPDLDIAGEILVAPVLGKVCESLGSDAGKIQLMVANGEQVVRDIVEDGVGDDAVRVGCVAQTSAIVQVAWA